MAILALFFKYQKVIRSYAHVPDMASLVAQEEREVNKLRLSLLLQKQIYRIVP